MKFNSRYGEKRKITNNGHGLYTIEGKSRYYRVGMNDANTKIAYFDPEGGPFISTGEDYGFGKIIEIRIESSSEGFFKIRVEVEQ